MDALKCIYTRRSIRKFNSSPIEEAKINQILKAALLAPSARNLQPVRLIVIDDRSILNKVPEFHPYAKMILEAPLAIAVCGDINISPGSIALDCAAATQNILLAAKALELGSVWLGIYNNEERTLGVKQLLELPENIAPVSLIVIGNPEEEKDEVDRFDLNKIRFNKWSE